MSKIYCKLITNFEEIGLGVSKISHIVDNLTNCMEQQQDDPCSITYKCNRTRSVFISN